MPLISINEVGSVGIVRDLPPESLPPEVWTDGRNVRFLDGKAVKFKGQIEVFDPPSVMPIWAMSVRTATAHFWMYASTEKVFALTGGVHTDITRTSGGNYGTTENLLWNGGIIGGIPVINNGVDDPQMWSPIGAGTPLVPLSNWPAATKAQILKPFKNQLIALDITISGDRFPGRVLFSSIADVGAVPASWDKADATKNAGDADLTDQHSGNIIDGLPLRDIFVIYRTISTWGAQSLEDQRVFRFYPILVTSGLLATDCVKVTPKGTHHFLMTGDDLVIFDGQNIESVIDKRMRRFLSNNIDTDNFARSFVAPNYRNREMWFCFPEIGFTRATHAIVWNMQDNSVGHRELSDISFIAPGTVDEDEPDDTWDGASGVWDTDNSIWDLVNFRGLSLDMLACDPVNTKLFLMDNSNQLNGTNMTSFVERTGLAIAGQDRQRRPIVDMTRRKLAKRVWPRVSGGPIEVQVGTQETLEGPITWGEVKTFDPATQHFVDVCEHGRLLAIRFKSNIDVAWELQGYDMEIELLGEI